jgi:hypothetical protein
MITPLVNKSGTIIKRWFAKVWKVRGGGLYACGYAVTFIVLEVTTVVGEIADATSIRDFFTSQLVEFIFRFVGDSLVNLIKALMWPVYFLEWNPVYGGIALGVMYFVFATYLKKPITDWLFPDDDTG